MNYLFSILSFFSLYTYVVRSQYIDLASINFGLEDALKMFKDDADDRKEPTKDKELDIGSILEQLSQGIDKKCEFKCINGIQPKKNPLYEPSSNGCGSFGIQLDTSSVPAVTRCCNRHDLCYDNCGSSKQTCDQKFGKCLEGVCEKLRRSLGAKSHQHTWCNDIGSLVSSTTQLFGCPAFLASQKKACSCGPSRSRESHSESLDFSDPSYNAPEVNDNPTSYKTFSTHFGEEL